MATFSTVCRLLKFETPEVAELGSDTLEQSVLPSFNFVKLETMQLLQCFDEQFLVYFSCVKFCLLCAPSDRISSTIKLYEPICRTRVLNPHQISYCLRASKFVVIKLQKKHAGFEAYQPLVHHKPSRS